MFKNTDDTLLRKSCFRMRTRNYFGQMIQGDSMSLLLICSKCELSTLGSSIRKTRIYEFADTDEAGT